MSIKSHIVNQLNFSCATRNKLVATSYTVSCDSQL